MSKRIDRVKLITEMAKREMRIIDLSEKSGVSCNTISAIRSGKNCSKLAANAIAQALELGAKDLMQD